MEQLGTSSGNQGRVLVSGSSRRERWRWKDSRESCGRNGPGCGLKVFFEVFSISEIVRRNKIIQGVRGSS